MTLCGTVSGRMVDLVAPDWRDIAMLDLARGLSLINRFAGQSRRAFSVAEHSLAVAALAPPALRLPALLHDGHEALFGDWPTPAVEALAAELPSNAVRLVIDRIKLRLDVAVARRVLEDAEATAEISLADEASWLASEMRYAEVRAADAEAFRLEDSVRRFGALQQGPSPATARACELYGVVAPHADAAMRDWLDAVREAARERYAP